MGKIMLISNSTYFVSSRKGKEIKPSNKYIITSDGTMHTLIIKKATNDDQTEITCAAANVKTSSKLKIEST